MKALLAVWALTMAMGCTTEKTIIQPEENTLGDPLKELAIAHGGRVRAIKNGEVRLSTLQHSHERQVLTI
jgi:hypothetical protein